MSQVRLGIAGVGLAGAVVTALAAAGSCFMGRSVEPTGRLDAQAPAPAATAPPGLVAQGAVRSAAGPLQLEAMAAARKLIRTAQITLEVRSYETAAGEVIRRAEAYGGYLADSQASRGQADRQSGTLTVRVPAEQFAAALAAFKELGKVRAENVGTQDVSKAYSDLETRLRVKRDTADRLREILRTRTAKLPDILEAERELARVTEEIEGMEGERRFYDRQVALSTISLTLQEPQAVVEATLFSPVADALRDSVRVLVVSLSGLVYLLVFLAPWSLMAVLGWRASRGLRSRRKAKAATVA